MSGAEMPPAVSTAQACGKYREFCRINSGVFVAMIYFLFLALALVVKMLLWKRAKKPFMHKNISQQDFGMFLKSCYFEDMTRAPIH